MSRVQVDISETEIEAESGRFVAGVRAECQKCGHGTESFGTGEGSRNRCLALMFEECPENEGNFYVDAEEEEDNC